MFRFQNAHVRAIGSEVTDVDAKDQGVAIGSTGNAVEIAIVREIVNAIVKGIVIVIVNANGTTVNRIRGRELAAGRENASANATGSTESAVGKRGKLHFLLII